MGVLSSLVGLAPAIHGSFHCAASPAGRWRSAAALLGLSLSTTVLAQAGGDLGSLCAKASCQARQAGISAEDVSTGVVARFARPAESPSAPLLLASDGFFYGTTESGGDFDLGTLFRISASGQYSLLHSFNFSSGAFPRGGLIQGADGQLYGTAEAGGFSGFGTVFRLAPEGTVSVLHDFDLDNGNGPFAELLLANDGRLYGTTRGGGANDLGTIFSLAVNGQQFSVLHSFGGADGAHPAARLLQAADGNLYGTTEEGGASDQGTVFRITPAGAFTSLHAFSGTDGAFPSGGLIVGSDGALYGLTYDGGPNSAEFIGGALYRITTAGALTVLYGFPAKASDGTFPIGELLLADDGQFYGVTQHGGNDFSGTVFRVPQASTALDPAQLSTVLHMSSGVNAVPYAGLVEDAAGVLYGTTEEGGPLNVGSIYALTKSGSVTALHSFGSSSGHEVTGLSLGGGTVYGSTRRGGQGRQGTLFSLSGSGPAQTLNSFVELGANPDSPPILASDGRLYGTTTEGGTDNFVGIAYRRESDGRLSLLHDFSGPDGAFVASGLHQAGDGSFYGSTLEGGANDLGSLFRLTDSGGFTLLHSFSGSDGRNPLSPPIQAGDGNFYGTTESGGSEDAGVLYRLSPAGQYSVLHHFAFSTGYYPAAGLVEGDDAQLYGTTTLGGGQGEGALFRISRSGQYELLHSFIGPTDGSNPAAPLLPGPGGSFFGSTQTGGSFGLGTVFQLQADGSLDTLHEFGGADGAFPKGALALLGEALYVPTAHFGPDGGGTVLRLSLQDPPPAPTPAPTPGSGGGGGGGSALNPGLLMVLAGLLALRRRNARAGRG